MSEYKIGGFEEDDPRSNLREFRSDYNRLDYSPTPLNPYHLKKNGRAYIESAQRHVRAVFESNLEVLTERPREAVIDLLEMSVASALFQRFERNSAKELSPDCDDRSSELFVKACLGSAEPSELLELLSRQPQLESIELAKQTHPFDWTATESMDGAIDYAMEDAGFSQLSERSDTARYYYARSNDHDQPGALIVIRKIEVGHTSGDHPDLTVVQRDSLVVDLEQPGLERVQKEVAAWLKSPQAKELLRGNCKVPYHQTELVGFLDTQLSLQSQDRSAALYPGVRSYYAYVSSDRKSLETNSDSICSATVSTGNSALITGRS